MKKFKDQLRKALLSTKPVEITWTSFKDIVTTPGTPQDVTDDRRDIWFHSAWWMYTLIMEAAETSPEEIEKLSNLIREEFEEFVGVAKRQKLIDKMKQVK